MSNEGNSVFARRIRLYGYVQKGEIGIPVLNDLLPDGEPHNYEHQLWDYKVEIPKLPIAPLSAGNNQANLEDSKIAELIKDAVSFYNSYGGYLVIGIRNSPREVVGYAEQFDCDDLNRRLKSVTK